MLHVSYTGKEHSVPRYDCNDAYLHHGEARCLSFGGLWVDEAVASEVLRAVEGDAVEAAVLAAEQIEQRHQELRKSLELEVEQARYEARLAARRYESVDPEQRLVAAVDTRPAGIPRSPSSSRFTMAAFSLPVTTHRIRRTRLRIG